MKKDTENILIKELSYPVMMDVLTNKAPFDRNKCEKCGGIGLVLIGCCNGRDCGCMGLPVDVDTCDCGAEEPSTEQLLKWANDGNS